MNKAQIINELNRIKLSNDTYKEIVSKYGHCIDSNLNFKDLRKYGMLLRQARVFGLTKEIK
jgi:hypothetical protein